MRKGLALAIAVLAWSAPAGAVEREHSVGLDLGPAVFVVADKGSPDIGWSAGLHYTYGLSDAFNLVADAGWSLVALHEAAPDSDHPHTRPDQLIGGTVGAAYVLDVLRWVPWGAAEAGVLALGGGTIGGVKPLPDVLLALGLDYRFTRSFAMGAALRQHMLVTDMSDYPSFTQVFLRLEYTWGW